MGVSSGLISAGVADCCELAATEADDVAPPGVVHCAGGQHQDAHRTHPGQLLHQPSTRGSGRVRRLRVTIEPIATGTLRRADVRQLMSQRCLPPVSGACVRVEHNSPTSAGSRRRSKSRVLPSRARCLRGKDRLAEPTP